MAYIGTPGGHTGDLHTEYLQKRHGDGTRGILHETYFRDFNGIHFKKAVNPCCSSAIDVKKSLEYSNILFYCFSARQD